MTAFKESPYFFADVCEQGVDPPPPFADTSAKGRLLFYASPCYLVSADCPALFTGRLFVTLDHVVTQLNYKVGAISTEHSSSELRVIRTNVRQVDSYFLHLTMYT